MRAETWELLARELEAWPDLVAGAAGADEVRRACHSLGVEPAQDYLEFVVRYGAGIVGPYRIYGLGRAEAMGVDEASMVAVTEHYRGPRWPGVEAWLVVSMDHAGNPIGLAEDGTVWLSDHDAGEVVQIASSFEDYLRRQCLHLSE